MFFRYLQKRADVLYHFHKELDWTHNIWIGVSVENEENLWRVDLLRKTKAKTKFLSCEPLLGSLKKMKLGKIDWVIVGGESGPKARPMKVEWIYEIYDKCEKEDVKFFFKQWGGPNKKKSEELSTAEFMMRCLRLRLQLSSKINKIMSARNYIDAGIF